MFTIYYAKYLEKSFLNITSKNFLVAVSILLFAALAYVPYIYYSVNCLHNATQGLTVVPAQELQNFESSQVLNTIYVIYLINFYSLYLIIILTLSLVT